MIQLLKQNKFVVSISLLYLLIMLAILAPQAEAQDIELRATFKPVGNAELYTIYQVDEQGVPQEVASGPGSPIDFKISYVPGAAFVITSSNGRFKSQYSKPVYWNNSNPPIIEVEAPPATPVIININTR